MAAVCKEGGREERPLAVFNGAIKIDSNIDSQLLAICSWETFHPPPLPQLLFSLGGGRCNITPRRADVQRMVVGLITFLF